MNHCSFVIITTLERIGCKRGGGKSQIRGKESEYHLKMVDEKKMVDKTQKTVIS